MLGCRKRRAVGDAAAHRRSSTGGWGCRRRGWAQRGRAMSASALVTAATLMAVGLVAAVAIAVLRARRRPPVRPPGPRTVADLVRMRAEAAAWTAETAPNGTGVPVLPAPREPAAAIRSEVAVPVTVGGLSGGVRRNGRGSGTSRLNGSGDTPWGRAHWLAAGGWPEPEAPGPGRADQPGDEEPGGSPRPTSTVPVRRSCSPRTPRRTRRRTLLRRPPRPTRRSPRPTQHPGSSRATDSGSTSDEAEAGRPVEPATRRPDAAPFVLGAVPRRGPAGVTRNRPRPARPARPPRPGRRARSGAHVIRPWTSAGVRTGRPGSRSSSGSPGGTGPRRPEPGSACSTTGADITTVTPTRRAAAACALRIRAPT